MKLPEISVRRPVTTVMVFAAITLLGCVAFFRLNLMSFIGVIMLMGIVVKNAIVIVNYTKQLRECGMSLNEAVVKGGRTRLRPALMTSPATIFGMVPLALSRGEGSEIWNALGITANGGLLVSGLVTLILVLLMYSLVHLGRAK